MKLMIVNGPNLNLLGIREPKIYGEESYAALEALCRQVCRDCGFDCEIFQSNHEGALVDKLQAARGDCDGIVINPAAYTHTSVAILDALQAVNLPTVEVHLTDVNRREAFRKTSYAGLACERHFIGYGFDGYRMAIEYLRDRLKK